MAKVFLIFAGLVVLLVVILKNRSNTVQTSNSSAQNNINMDDSDLSIPDVDQDGNYIDTQQSSALTHEIFDGLETD